MSTKDLIQAELDELDESLLEDIYLFIKTFIWSKRARSGLNKDLSMPSILDNPSLEVSDPLSTFIGAVAHGSLASDIDSDLYDA